MNLSNRIQPCAICRREHLLMVVTSEHPEAPESLSCGSAWLAFYRDDAGDLRVVVLCRAPDEPSTCVRMFYARGDGPKLELVKPRPGGGP